MYFKVILYFEHAKIIIFIDLTKDAPKKGIFASNIHKKLFKFNSMFFLKYMNGIFFTFPQSQWNPIVPSERQKICSPMSIIKLINQI